MIKRFQQLDQGTIKQGPRDIWLLEGNDEKTKRAFAQTLAKTFLNQEKKLVILDGLFCNIEQMAYLHQRLKKNPFQIIYIENYSYLSQEMAYIFKEIIEQGEVRIQNQTFDFSSSIILADAVKQQRKMMGFVPVSEIPSISSFHFNMDKSQSSKVM